MFIYGIDPGPKTSGIVKYDTEGKRVVWADSKCETTSIVNSIAYRFFSGNVAIEMVAPYGMAVGDSIFRTILFIGMMINAAEVSQTTSVFLITRKEVLMTLCNSVRAKQKNLRRALFDRFPQTGGGKEPAVGVKKQPGPLFGVSSHAIDALAVAVTLEDILKMYQPERLYNLYPDKGEER